MGGSAPRTRRSCCEPGELSSIHRAWKAFTLLGMTGEAKRKVIRSATEAAEKISRGQICGRMLGSDRPWLGHLDEGV